MSNMRRSKRLVALAAGLSLVAAAACGGDDDDDDGDGRPTAPAAPRHRPTTEAPGTDAPPAPTHRHDGSRRRHRTTTGGTGGATGETAMTLTVDINPDAVWEDGSPITWADFECTWQATANTPGSVITAGLRPVTAVDRRRERQAGHHRVQPRSTARTRRCSTGIIKSVAVENCNDISGRLRHRACRISGRAVLIESWSHEPVRLRAQRDYWGDDSRSPSRSCSCRRPTRRPRSPRSCPARSTSSTRSSPTRSARR